MYECRSYLIVDGNGAEAVQKEQQERVHIMEQVPGLMALRAEREADLRGPTGWRTNGWKTSSAATKCDVV